MPTLTLDESWSWYKRVVAEHTEKFGKGVCLDEDRLARMVHVTLNTVAAALVVELDVPRHTAMTLVDVDAVRDTLGLLADTAYCMGLEDSLRAENEVKS